MSAPYEDKIIKSPDEPMVDALTEAYRRASPWQNNWNRLTGNDDVRFMRWENQFSDGKKHDTDEQEAFPWDGASDLTSPKMAEEIINLMVAICTVAFWRTMLRADAMGAEDVRSASNFTKLIEFFRRTFMLSELATEVELSAQYFQSYGWCVLHPTWVREIGLRMYRVELQVFTGLAQATAEQDPNSPFAQLPEIIQDPAMEKQAASMLKILYTDYIRTNVSGLREDEIPEVSEKRLRRAVKDLREHAAAEFPLPYLAANKPSVKALKPWEEVVFSDDTTDIQRSKMFVRCWMSEAELRDRARAENWNEEWVEEAVKQKGKFTDWATYQQNYVTEFDGAWHFAEQQAYYDSIEVVYAYTKRFDEDGVSGVYLTVFHPGFGRDHEGNDLVAQHGLLEYRHGEIPGVLLSRERWTRNFTFSRGVSNVVASHQREAKIQRDSLVDRSALTTTPPLLTPAGQMETDYVLGPAQQLPFLPGREPRYLPTPGLDGVSLKLIEILDSEMARYFGMPSPAVHPSASFAHQSMMVTRFLMAWQLAFRQVAQLMPQYLTSAEYQRIMGEPPSWSDEPKEIAGMYDTILQFDVRELDFDFVKAKLETISKLVLPTDAAGVIDRHRLVALQLQAIDPSIATAVQSDRAGASQKLYDEMKEELALLFLGNPASPVENDPAAGAKLQFLQQIIAANPVYSEELNSRPNGTFAGSLKKLAQSLQFSIQQQRNAVIGRVGVDPDA